MPKCSVVGCGIRKSENCPKITLHRLPKSDSKRKMWLDKIGVENIKRNTKIIFICCLHFEESCFNRTLTVTTLRDDAVPSLNFFPKNPTLAKNKYNHTTQIETVIKEAVKLAQSSLKTSDAAHRPLLKVQSKATSAQTDSTCRDCNDIHPITLTPLVIVDIPPAAAIQTIAPVIIQEKPTFDIKKESKLRSRCAFLEKQLRAWKEKVRRRGATLDKVKAEKEEVTIQYLRTLELLKSGDKTDYHFEDILQKAVMKLS